MNKPLLFAWHFCLLLSMTGFGQGKAPGVAPTPGWTSVSKIDYSITALEKDAEDGYHQLAYEKQVSLSDHATYYRRCMRILSEAGVENNSDISVPFDPSYEQLQFHSIKVIRDGDVINKLNPRKFRMVQQEKELNKHLYNGTITAFLTLDDIRKGDIIEYSYTKRGENPVFKGKFSEFLDTRFGVPVTSMYFKVIVPAGRTINVRNHIETTQPMISKSGTNTIYEWKLANLPGQSIEPNTPSWFDPYPFVMLSEYNTWNEVAQWAAGLFPSNPQLSPALQQKVKSILAASTADDTRTLAALRFVQDDIRYMGIEMGENSHQPHNPNKVFEQRFGDCKDKSYLLVTMLKAMNIQARPVLINTYLKHNLSERLPTASTFDHVTVFAKVNGKDYWFDPTISYQRGTLDEISYPDYQAGLVIADTTKDLTAIPFKPTGRVDIREIFTLTNISGKATLKVETVNTGSYADNARYTYNTNSVSGLKSSYKDFYANYIDQIVADSLTYTDDASGAFSTYEYYTIENVWKSNDGKKGWSFSPYVINSLLKKPSDKNRTMPYGLSFPAQYKEQIVINLPEDWNTTDFAEHINCAGFSMNVQSSHTDQQVVLDYDFTILKDHVTSDEAAAFYDSYTQAYDNTGFGITYGDSKGAVSSPGSPAFTTASPGNIFTKLYIILGLCVGITILVKKGKKNRESY